MHAKPTRRAATVAAFLGLTLVCSLEVAAQQAPGVFSLGALLKLGCVLFGVGLTSQLVMITLAARWVGVEGGVGRSFLVLLVSGVITIILLFLLLKVVGNSLNEWMAGILVQSVSILALCISVKWLFHADLKRSVVIVFLATGLTTVILCLVLLLLYGL